MKKSIISLLPTAIGLVVGCYVLMFIAALISQVMTYDKKAFSLPRYDYVREVTRWAGHTFGNNIPVWYGK